MLLFLLACATPETAELPVCPIDPPSLGALTAQGTELRDEAGRVVALRGLNAGGRSKFSPYLPFDYTDYDAALTVYLDRLTTWGVDVLRVPYAWQALEPSPGVFDTVWLDQYSALLDGAAARGIWTIVDFHQDLYAESFCGDGFPLWTLSDPGEPRHDCENWFYGYVTNSEVKEAFTAFWDTEGSVQAAFIAQWEHMVTTHAERPGVIGYELINEPIAGTLDSATWNTEIAPELYSRLGRQLQGIDPDALIFFDSAGADAATGETALARPDGENLVFAPHAYDPSVFFGGDPDPAAVEGRLRNWAAVGAEWDLPVLIGEMGSPADRANLTEYVTAHFDTLDATGMHGTWWEYSAAAELWNYEDFSVVEADGTERPVFLDGLVRPYARAVAGTVEVVGYAEGVFTLRYAAEADGITEIMLPPRIYQGLYRVEGSGACADRRGDRVYLRATGDMVEVEVRGG